MFINAIKVKCGNGCKIKTNKLQQILRLENLLTQFAITFCDTFHLCFGAINTIGLKRFLRSLRSKKFVRSRI